MILFTLFLLTYVLLKLFIYSLLWQKDITVPYYLYLYTQREHWKSSITNSHTDQGFNELLITGNHTFHENSEFSHGGSCGVHSIEQSMIAATSQKNVHTSSSVIIATMFVTKGQCSCAEYGPLNHVEYLKDQMIYNIRDMEYRLKFKMSWYRCAVGWHYHHNHVCFPDIPQHLELCYGKYDAFYLITINILIFNTVRLIAILTARCPNTISFVSLHTERILEV